MSATRCTSSICRIGFCPFLLFKNSDNIKNNMRFVTITVEEREDEQQIFDAINSLGVKLTTAELLKNYFFNQNNEADFDRYWKPVLTELICPCLK